MCFGGSNKQTSTTNQSGTSAQQQNASQTGSATYTPTTEVANAAKQNLNYVTGLQDLGYTPYQGDRVADFSGLQNASFDAAGNIINDPNATDWATKYGNAPAQSIGYSKIAEMMGPYMSQYVEQSLLPQLRMQKYAFDDQNRAGNAAATMSNAFGDDRAAIEAVKREEAQNAAREGLISNAYNTAFNTAIGAGAQDVANKNQVGTTNASLQEQALQRMLQGGLQGLNSKEQIANFAQQLGALQQQQEQAKLNVPYSDYLAAMQYPFLTSQLLNQAIGTGAQAMPASVNTSGTSQGTATGQTTGQGTTVTTSPNNSGLGLLGAVAGGLMSNPAVGAGLIGLL